MLVLHRTTASPARGYTLLEILFVLLLIGLVGSVVVPRVDGLYDSVVLGGEREDILNRLRELPLVARHQGQEVSLSGATAQSLLPADSTLDWTLSASQGLRYRANGFCTGGTVTLNHGSGRSWSYNLEAPFCVPREIEGT